MAVCGNDVVTKDVAVVNCWLSAIGTNQIVTTEERSRIVVSLRTRLELRKLDDYLRLVELVLKTLEPSELILIPATSGECRLLRAS